MSTNDFYEKTRVEMRTSFQINGSQGNYNEATQRLRTIQAIPHVTTSPNAINLAKIDDSIYSLDYSYSGLKTWSASPQVLASNCSKRARDQEMESKPQGGEYQDLLPVMADKLDVDIFVAELCGGFRLLADPTKGLITSTSLLKNCKLLGLEGMTEEDAEAMVREGDLDRDGSLNEMEFCILMVRLSPGMMQDAENWLDKAIEGELQRASA